MAVPYCIRTIALQGISFSEQERFRQWTPNVVLKNLQAFIQPQLESASTFNVYVGEGMRHDHGYDYDQE